MKKIEPIKQIFQDAGHACDYNRKNRWFKALAELHETGLVKFFICTKGQVWVPQNQKPYNIKVIAGDWMKKFHRKNTTTITPYDVLVCVGRLLQDPQVKESIKSYVNLDLSCDRCQGQGYIRQFSYYCNGICFECFGTGYSRHKKVSVKIDGPAAGPIYKRIPGIFGTRTPLARKINENIFDNNFVNPV